MSDEATQCIQYSPNKPNKLRKFHIHFLRPPPSKLFQYQRKLKLASEPQSKCVKWKQNLFYTLQTQEERRIRQCGFVFTTSAVNRYPSSAFSQLCRSWCSHHPPSATGGLGESSTRSWIISPSLCCRYSLGQWGGRKELFIWLKFTVLKFNIIKSPTANERGAGGTFNSFKFILWGF